MNQVEKCPNMRLSLNNWPHFFIYAVSVYTILFRIFSGNEKFGIGEPDGNRLVNTKWLHFTNRHCNGMREMAE